MQLSRAWSGNIQFTCHAEQMNYQACWIRALSLVSACAIAQVETSVPLTAQEPTQAEALKTAFEVIADSLVPMHRSATDLVPLIDFIIDLSFSDRLQQNAAANERVGVGVISRVVAPEGR